MQLWRRLYILVFVAALICFCTGFFQFKVSAQINFSVHNLNTDLFYATINEAIADNATLDGHVIEVGAGVYYEHVVLTKAVSLVGENCSNTIIDGQGNGTVVDILTSNVTVTGFTIRNGGSVSGRSGVHVKGSSFCKVFNNIIEGNWWGIYIESCSNITISKNNLTINSYGANVYSSLNVSIVENEFLMNDYAVWVSACENFDFLLNNVSNNGHGIWMTQSMNAVLNENRVFGNADGVLIYYSNDTLLFENVISSDEGNAIYLSECTNTKVFGCQIFSSGDAAVRIIYSTSNNLTENDISSNGFDGVYLQQSSNNFVYSNNVSDCRNALAFYWCVDNIISANILVRNDFGIALSSSDAKIFGNEVSGNDCGVFVNNSTDVEVSENIVVSNGDGLRLKGCLGNYIFNNTLSFNVGFALILNSSDNCSVSGNNFLRNGVGLCLREFAEGNVVTNNSFYENDYGIFVENSNNDSIVFNKLFANDVGAMLLGCVNVTVLYNEFVGNNVGFVLNMSVANGFYNNVLDRNEDGVRVVSSFNNTCMFNAVSSNVGFGVYVSNSSFNVFLYNSFFNNSLVGSFNSSNFWDNGVEGNFWGYEGFVDDNRDGLGDFAFVIGEGERDNFPLMGEYTRFFVNVGDNRYLVSVVSNSSVSNFVYFRDPGNLTSVVSFRVGASEGLGFCRVCLPHALVQPPFEVRVDNITPLYYSVVKSNASHSWLYFAFPYIGGDVRIVTGGGAPFWTELWFWGIVGLAVVVGFLAVAVFLFYRRLSLYKKRIEEFERRLRERELSPLEVARRFFNADVERRSVKIGRFEEKYGVKIRPRDSLEDILRVLESKQKEKKDEEAG